jgi:hypothetical protein
VLQRFVLGVAVTAASLALAVAAGAAGFKTTTAAMLTPVGDEVTVDPIISVGDTLPDGYRFESIPDGIALRPYDGGLADVFVNHETSVVPFPANLTDVTNAMVSRLALDSTGAVLGGHYAIPSEANYQRFCSNFLAGRAQGFERDVLFTNEETSDTVNRSGAAWPAGPNGQQAGVVVAVDLRTNRFKPIYSMGRMNHENAVAVPGYGHPVVMTGDDTFTAPSSQLYLYTAPSASALLADRGELWAFQSDDASVNDYGDLSGTASVSGHFIPVPRDVAVGDQTALETWSNDHGVFQFIRVEDMAYDRTTPNVVYFADTGEPRALAGPGSARMTRGPAGTTGPYPNGRIFKMVLDPSDPTVVQSLSILIDGDSQGADGAKKLELIHQPDNVETTASSLLIQEDPGSQNQYAPDDAAGTTARIWRYDLASGALTVAARVNQTADPAAQQGSWESSGIVDASAVFGPGAFLTNVQAHTIFVDTEVLSPTLTAKREAGQMLLIRIPGA